MPENDEEVQNEVETKLGVQLCLWQIHIVCMILKQDDLVSITWTGVGKSRIVCVSYTN